MTSLLLLSLSQRATAQDCSCPEGSVVIGSPDNPFGVTFLSASDLPSQTYSGCLKIHGTLIITSNYKFDNCEIYLEKGAQIEVKPARKLTIDSTSLVGCTNMWKGIKLQNNAKLDLTNSTIKDAQYAIYALNYSYLYLQNNIFDANYVGLYVPEKPGYSTNKIHFENDDIDENYFVFESEYKLPYVGQIPHPGENPYAGIYIKDSKYITIGKPSDSSTPVRNYFSNLRFGAIFDGCRYTGLYGGEFSDLKYDMDNSFISGGTGVLITKGDKVEIKYCKFEKVRTGLVAVENERMNLRYNDIAAEENGIFVFGNDRTTLVDFNEIYSETKDGIVIGNGSSQHPLKVKNNTIRPYLVGIHMENWEGPLEVENNTIEFAYSDNNNMRHGMVATNLAGPTFIQGNDFVTADTAITHVRQAIVLNLCQNSLVKENFIFGPTYPGSTWEGGIFSNFSPSNKICCNSISNTRKGVFFTGACTDTRLANTIFGGNQGVPLFMANAEISPQVNTGNNWSLIESYGVGFTPDAWYIGETSLITNSQIIMQADLMPNGLTNVIVPPDLNPEDWFVFEGIDSLCEEQYNCREDVIKAFGQPNQSGEISAQLMEALNPGPATNPVLANFYWEKQRNLFQKIYENPVLKAKRPALANFYSDTEKEVLGQLQLVGNGMRQLPSIGNDLREELALLTEEIATYETLNRQDNLEIEALELEALILDQKIREIERLIRLNASIQTDTEFELNQKIYNDIYLNTIAKGIFEFTPAQKSQIDQIAALCPMEHGTAVYLMRTLQRWYNPEAAIIREDCLPSLEQPSLQEIPAETSGAASIYPNPVADELFVQFDKVNLEGTISLRLSNMSGVAVYSDKNNFNSGTHSIKVNHLPAGLYNLELREESGAAENYKIVIQ